MAEVVLWLIVVGVCAAVVVLATRKNDRNWVFWMNLIASIGDEKGNYCGKCDHCTCDKRKEKKNKNKKRRRFLRFNDAMIYAWIMSNRGVYPLY